jgi:hypothetical protein
MRAKRQDSLPTQIENAATRTVASTLGVLVGIGSIDHGLLECLQGFRPTPGLLVNALGPGYRWTAWTEGGEGAFTLIPNFLVTGIVATLFGLLMILWALRFLQTAHGATVFLLLGVASFLSGGGVAQLVLFTLTWAVATRIHAPLAFWRWLLPPAVRSALGRMGPWTLAAATVLFLAALEIAVFGYVPSVSSHRQLFHVCWTLLALALALYFLSIVSAFARDLKVRAEPEQG